MPKRDGVYLACGGALFGAGMLLLDLGAVVPSIMCAVIAGAVLALWVAP